MKTFAYVISITVDISDGWMDNEVKARDVEKHVRETLANSATVSFDVVKATVIPIREDTME